MLPKLRYIFGGLISIPLLPIIIYQGEKIRKEVPELPEAKMPEGYIDISAPSSITVLLIGESTFAGVGVDTHEEGFAGSLAQKISEAYEVNVKWKVYARSGYTAKKMNERLLPKIKEKHADLIVIGAGGNDAFTVNRPNRWKKDMNSLIKSIQKKYPDSPIACTNMPPIKIFPAFTKTIKFVIGNLGEILGDELASLTNKMPNVYYNAERINNRTWKDQDGNTLDLKVLFSEGVHPSGLTYALWAENFGQFIKREKILSDLTSS